MVDYSKAGLIDEHRFYITGSDFSDLVALDNNL